MGREPVEGMAALKKGKLVAEDGTKVAIGLTLREAKERFP